jgi:phosphoribosylanthranilate isomerase
MFVKICGLISLDEALICAEAGADMIGLNFYKAGVRYIEPAKAKEIARALRQLVKPPTLVGVFVNESADFMQKILDECELDLAQLSGLESEETLQAMGARSFKVIRNLESPISNLQRLNPPHCLVDASVKGVYGGSGQTADWQMAATLATHHRILLAGGLTPENVAQAIQQVKPWGVDVASGVESSPAKKDASKVKKFIERAKTEIRD